MARILKRLKDGFGVFLRTLPFVKTRLLREDERELRAIFKLAGVSYEEVKRLPPLPASRPSADDLRLEKMRSSDVYKATEEKIAQVKALIEENPNISIKELSVLSGVSQWTLSNRW